MRQITRFVHSAVLLALSATASADPALVSVTLQKPIAAQSLVNALETWAQQSGVQVMYTAELASGLLSRGAPAGLSAGETLEKLLSGTGLRFRVLNERTISVIREGSSGASLTGDTHSLGRFDASSGVMRVAQAHTESPNEARLDGLDEVVVTGSYTRGSANSATGLNMTLRETPQSVTVISRERIEDQNLWEVSDVVNQSVGLHYDGSTLGSDSTSFYARGFAVTNFQLDGIPRPSAIYGFQVTTDDMVAYERVEIVRGATGLMNGVGNPSASMNFIRKRPTRDFSGNLMLQVGSWNSYRPQVDFGGPLTESGRIRGRVAAAYQQADSHLTRMHLEKQAAYGIVEADVADSTLLSVGMQYQGLKNHDAPRSAALPFWTSDGARANFPRSSNPATDWSVLSNSDLTLFSGLEHSFANGWLIKLRAEHLTADYDDIMGYARGYLIDPVSGSGASLMSGRWSADLEQNFGGAYAQGEFELFGRKHELTFGLSTSESVTKGPGYCGWYCGGEYRRPLTGSLFDFFRSGDEAQPSLAPDGTHTGSVITQTAAYAALRLKPTDRIATILGARVTNWRNRTWNETVSGLRTYAQDTDESGVITPYAGIVFNLTKHLSLYASATQIFEPAVEQDIDGNILDPLQGNNYEAGLKTEFNEGRLSASLGFFKIEQDNFPVPLNGVLNPRGVEAYRAEKGAVSKGFELEIAGELLPGWQAVGGFSRTDSQDRLGSPLMPEIPANTFKLFTSYRLRGALEGLTLGGNVRWQSETRGRYVGNPVSGEMFEQGSFVVVDVMTKYAVSEKATVQLNVNNVFDKTYFSGVTAYLGTYGIPRSVAASVQWNF